MAIDLPGLYQYRNQLIEHMYIDTYFNGKFLSTNKHPRYDEMKEAYDEIEKMIEEYINSIEYNVMLCIGKMKIQNNLFDEFMLSVNEATKKLQKFRWKINKL